MSYPEITITGLGAVTPLGNNIPENWNAVLNGEKAFSQITRFELKGLSYTIGGMISQKDIAAADIAARSVSEALDNAGLKAKDIALITGSNFGEKFESTPVNHYAVANAVTVQLGIGGLVASTSLSCSSGTAAIALAADWIKCGRAKAVAVVGVDVISLYSWSGLSSLRTISKEGIVRPFDPSRAGTVFAEGAAAVILEDYAFCTARNGKALALLTGWATGNNGFHLTAPPARAAGSRLVMQNALVSSGLTPDDIDFVTMHATGTKANDLTEAEAVTDIFGEKSTAVPVTAIKASSGHLLGAAGAFEAAMTVLALRESSVPPVAVKPAVDPAIPYLNLVTDKPLPLAAENAITNSAGFGGCNASLVVSKTSHQTNSPAPASAKGAVIISAGFISPLGIGFDEAQAAIEENEPAIFPAERIKPPEGATDEAGEIPPFEPSEILPSPKAFLDRQALLALAASSMAMRELDNTVDKNRFGISAGTSWGPVETQELFYSDCLNKGPRFVRPMLFPHTYANAAASIISIEWELRGTHCNFAGGDNASSFALTAALDALNLGECDRILTGGSESLSTTRWARGLQNKYRTTPPGEGAAFFVLEKDKGQKALGKVLGAGLSSISPEDAAEFAIKDSEIKHEDISAVYASCDIEGLSGFTGIPFKHPELLTGICDGASCAIQLAYALADNVTGNFLILTHEGNTYAALVTHK